tara:strand:+ start:1287 stop:1997 length:711 start_codon:yes stop_codon:yes gene_type:complete
MKNKNSGIGLFNGLENKSNVKFILFSLLLFGFTLNSNHIYSQTLQNIYHPSIAKKFNLAGKSIKYKTAIFINFDSEEKPDFYHFENQISLDIYKGNKFKLEGSFKYRRYNIFDENITNEFRPAQTIKFSKKSNGLILDNSFKFEQRFRETYSNRWRYKFQIGGLNRKSKIFSGKLNNEFLCTFNKDKTGYENRFLITLSDNIMNLPVSFSIQHRLKNIFSEKDLKHLIVIKTDFSF